MRSNDTQGVLDALVLDDEPLARADLEALLKEHGGVRVAAEAASVAEAVRVMAELGVGSGKNPIDVVFLDIQLRGGDGFELLPHLPAEIPVIFITAHDEYALRAFEVNALDYLLKPVSPERLARTIDRLRPPPALPGTDESATLPRVGLDDSVLVRTEGSRCFIRVGAICAISSVGGNYTELRIDDGKRLLARTTLKQWEARLPVTGFVRIHRGAIVNAARIVEIQMRSGQPVVRVEGHEEGFPVSRRMASRLKG